MYVQALQRSGGESKEVVYVDEKDRKLGWKTEDLAPKNATITTEDANLT